MFNRKIFSLFNKSQKRTFFFILFCMVAFSFLEALGLSLILPFISALINAEQLLQLSPVQQTFQFLSLQQNASTLITLITFLFISTLSVKLLLNIYVNHQITRFPYSIFKEKTTLLFEKYLRMSYIDYTSSNSNILLKNCTITSSRSSLAITAYLQYLKSAIVIAFLLSLLLLKNPLISLALFGFFLAVAFGTYKTFKTRQENAGVEEQRQLDVLFKVTSEAFLSFKEIRLLNKTAHFCKKFKNVLYKLSDALQNQAFFSLLPIIIIEYIILVSLLSLILFFVLSDISLEKIFPQLIFYAAVAKQLLPALNISVTTKGNLQSLQAHVDTLVQELEKDIDQENILAVPSEKMERTLGCKNVSFSYMKGKKTLQNISFSLEKGHSIAFVGPSGAGKTTLIEILTSLLVPADGNFTLDTNKLPSLLPLREEIGYVSQIVTLLDDTIENNIAFGEDEVDKEALEKVIKMAHLEEFIHDLPEGCKTRIGERGIKISGGQRQRIGIARALYPNPSILIFDEATSSLDSVSERIITNTIIELSGSKTIIAIAHRLSTIQHFDIIHVMERGTIVDKGSHSELIVRCPIYRELNSSEKNTTEQVLQMV
jgi:ATP-binding cassette, subfamily B, bacterial PglK